MKSDLKSNRKTMLVLLSLTLAMILVLSGVLYFGVYRQAKKDALAATKSRLLPAAQQSTDFLSRGISVASIAADTLNAMLARNDSQADIQAYLTQNTSLMSSTVDSNIIDLYGWFRGEYMDGSGWKPGKDFIPTERPWYLTARSNPGSPVFVSPYFDARTEQTIISVAVLLRDGESVLSMDIETDEIVTCALDVLEGHEGLTLLVDPDGSILSASDPNHIGMNYLMDASEDTLGLAEIISDALSTDDTFSCRIGGKTCQVFSVTLDSGWEIMLISSNVHVLRGILIPTIICFIVLLILLIALAVYLEKFFSNERVLLDVEKNKLAEAKANEAMLRVDAAIIGRLAGEMDFIGLIDTNRNIIRNYRSAGIFADKFDPKSAQIEPWEFDRVLRNLLPFDQLTAFLKLVDRDVLMEAMQSSDRLSVPCNLLDGEQYVPCHLTFTFYTEDTSIVILGIQRDSTIEEKHE